MDHPLPSPDALVRPWRTATLVASGVAALELVALVVAGGALLAKPLSHQLRRSAEARAFAAPVHDALPKTIAVGAPRLAREETGVYVFNGNGRSGAASAAATRLRGLGYVIGGTGNAPRSDYATSVVMYRPGFKAEGVRLAQDLKVKVVGPLDGLKASDLLGAHVALVLGN
jgi:hypothetical protein